MKKIQLTIDEKKDPIVYELIKRFEEDSDNVRGYVNEQIKQILMVMSILGSEYGEHNPVKLAIKLTSGVKEVKKIDNEQVTSNQENDPNVMNFIADIGRMNGV